MTNLANPYAEQLGDRPAREVIAETPQQLRSLLVELSPDGLELTYGPGKWTARMILCHLADCEICFGFRLRQTLAEEHHVIQPFDQEAWAQQYGNHSLQARAAVEVFGTLRAWNLALIDNLSSESWSKPVRHPERGEMTFRTIVETMGGHDLNHRRQLETIAAGRASRV
ncbi:MAG: DinB family protein [Acidobacteriaceae bacterium]|nr:DinB family protein [Acidobacteriaceae bacterium]